MRCQWGSGIRYRCTSHAKACLRHFMARPSTISTARRCASQQKRSDRGRGGARIRNGPRQFGGNAGAAARPAKARTRRTSWARSLLGQAPARIPLRECPPRPPSGRRGAVGADRPNKFDATARRRVHALDQARLVARFSAPPVCLRLRARGARGGALSPRARRPLTAGTRTGRSARLPAQADAQAHVGLGPPLRGARVEHRTRRRRRSLIRTRSN